MGSQQQLLSTSIWFSIRSYLCAIDIRHKLYLASQHSHEEDPKYDAFEAQLRVFGREIVPKEVILGKVIGVGTRCDIYTSWMSVSFLLMLWMLMLHDSSTTSEYSHNMAASTCSIFIFCLWMFCHVVSIHLLCQLCMPACMSWFWCAFHLRWRS